jgi:hypothetical protein
MWTHYTISENLSFAAAVAAGKPLGVRIGQ